MKKYLAAILLTMLIFTNGAYSYTQDEVNAADFLAYLGVIVARENESEYNLDSSITRKEMLKVMMNISGIEITEKCEGKFSDLQPGNWGCKYAEIALEKGMIAPNESFRPGDNVSKIESLKMVFKGIGLEREENEDWKEGYVNTAVANGLISQTYTDYGVHAKRGSIFTIAENAILLKDEGSIDILNFLLKDF